MQTQEDIDAVEAQELRDKIWMFTQRIAVALVIFLAGLLLGLIKPTAVAPLFRPLGIQGPAGQLREEVDQLTERNQGLVKERDTLRSKVALMDRDLKEMDRQVKESEARAAACGGAPGAVP
jgi:hypothetical protein